MRSASASKSVFSVSSTLPRTTSVSRLEVLARRTLASVANVTDTENPALLFPDARRDDTIEDGPGAVHAVISYKVENSARDGSSTGGWCIDGDA